MTDMPTLCLVEYLNKSGEWTVGHGSYNFMNPTKYVNKMALGGKNGIYGVRLTGDDGKVYEKSLELELCEFCEEAHHPPFDGTCIL
jgi:hypothetical protein